MESTLGEREREILKLIESNLSKRGR